MRTEAAVLVDDTETETKASPDLKHTNITGRRTTRTCDEDDEMMSWCSSPRPACVQLDDLDVTRFGPQQPGVPAVLPVVWAAVTVQDVVAMETLKTTDLMQLKVLLVIREVEGPQRRLLQDNTRYTTS